MSKPFSTEDSQTIHQPVFLWRVLSLLVGMHLMAGAALFFFTWKALACLIVMLFVTGFGVSIGMHRLLTHNSFKTKKWVERLLALCGALSIEGMTSWVGMHRMHHAFSDTAKDPHDASRGFLWSHIGYVLYADADDYLSKAPKFMQNERYYRFLETYGWTLQIPLGGILYLIGGWPCVMFGIFLRVVLFWHITFLVNSATHIWGYTNYQINDRSRNTWWVAILSFGEGWHNNHHAQPKCAQYGHKPWEIDSSWWVIRVLMVLGLAWDVRLPKDTAATVEVDEPSALEADISAYPAAE
jgi:sn-1 stearoyl-lipid 9-desaturase